jgi:hypothetical protein
MLVRAKFVEYDFDIIWMIPERMKCIRSGMGSNVVYLQGIDYQAIQVHSSEIDQNRHEYWNLNFPHVNPEFFKMNDEQKDKCYSYCSRVYITREYEDVLLLSQLDCNTISDYRVMAKV